MSKVSTNLLVLKANGKPRLFTEWLDVTIRNDESILGVLTDSPRFVDGIEMIVSMDVKFGIFRSKYVHTFYAYEVSFTFFFVR